MVDPLAKTLLLLLLLLLWLLLLPLPLRPVGADAMVVCLPAATSEY